MSLVENFIHEHRLKLVVLTVAIILIATLAH